MPLLILLSAGKQLREAFGTEEAPVLQNSLESVVFGVGKDHCSCSCSWGTRILRPNHLRYQPVPAGLSATLTVPAANLGTPFETQVLRSVSCRENTCLYSSPRLLAWGGPLAHPRLTGESISGYSSSANVTVTPSAPLNICPVTDLDPTLGGGAVPVLSAAPATARWGWGWRAALGGEAGEHQPRGSAQGAACKTDGPLLLCH